MYRNEYMKEMEATYKVVVQKNLFYSSLSANGFLLIKLRARESGGCIKGSD